MTCPKFHKAKKGSKVAELIFYEWQIENKFLSDALNEHLENTFVVDKEFVAHLEAEREKSCEPKELAVVYIKDILEMFN